MPYKSEDQRKFFHANKGKLKGLTAKVVGEWDKESRGKSLPKKVKKKKTKKRKYKSLGY